MRPCPRGPSGSGRRASIDGRISEERIDAAPAPDSDDENANPASSSSSGPRPYQATPGLGASADGVGRGGGLDRLIKRRATTTSDEAKPDMDSAMLGSIVNGPGNGSGHGSNGHTDGIGLNGINGRGRFHPASRDASPTRRVTHPPTHPPSPSQADWAGSGGGEGGGGKGPPTPHKGGRIHWDGGEELAELAGDGGGGAAGSATPRGASTPGGSLLSRRAAAANAQRAASAAAKASSSSSIETGRRSGDGGSRDGGGGGGGNEKQSLASSVPTSDRPDWLSNQLPAVRLSNSDNPITDHASDRLPALTPGRKSNQSWPNESDAAGPNGDDPFLSKPRIVSSPAAGRAWRILPTTSSNALLTLVS
jgi:hypothetical protein